MTRLLPVVLGLFLLALSPIDAGALEPVKGPTVLTVDGAIGKANAEAAGRKLARIDRQMLAALPQRAFRTATPWYPEPREFKGPMQRDVLGLVGAGKGRELKVVAINDYAASIPFADAELDVIVATHIDGQPIPVREKGPLFIIYNFDANPKLRTEQYFGRSVWQVKAIEVLD